MDRSLLERWTTSADPAGLPCSQCWINASEAVGLGRAWWDVNYLWSGLQAAGEQRCRRDWFRWLKCVLRSNTLSDHLVPRANDTPSDAVCDVITSTGLYTFFAAAADKSRTVGVQTACVGYLRQAARLVNEACTSAVDIIPVGSLEDGVQLQYLGVDRVKGLDSWLTAAGSAQGTLRRCWTFLHSQGVVREALGGDHQSFGDVLCFVPCICRARRLMGSTHRFGIAQIDRISKLLRYLIHWTAQHVDNYLLRIYGPSQNTSKPAPALRRHTLELAPGGTRQYVRIGADAVWEFIQDALRGGISLGQLLRARSGDEHAGCSDSQAEGWQNKFVDIYRQRRASTFDGVHHINLVSDASIHGRGQDTVLSLGYSWETGGCI